MLRFFPIMALILSFTAFAQVERDVVELNDQIRQLVLSRSFDQRTLLRVKNQLENVLLTLDGSTGEPNGTIKSFKCVSRDNDNRSPYIFAVELSDFSLRRIAEYKFNSLESCQSKAQAARFMVGGVHTCVSRDNDDSNPFVIATFYADRTSKRTEVFKDLIQCQSVMNAARVSSEAWMICVPRDNDGSAPWIRVVTKRDGQSVRQSETFSSFESCQAQ